MQADQYYPCSVRFFFSTGLNDHDGQQRFQATDCFPLLHGESTRTVPCQHSMGQGEVNCQVCPQLQSFPVLPTLCIGGSFKVQFVLMLQLSITSLPQSDIDTTVVQY